LCLDCDTDSFARLVCEAFDTGLHKGKRCK
jgi:hypothetical protein